MTCVKNGKLVQLEQHCYKDVCGDWEFINDGWVAGSTVCRIAPIQQQQQVSIPIVDLFRLVTEDGKYINTESYNRLLVS
jgi:hypothetical protein